MKQYISYEQWLNKVLHPLDELCRNREIFQYVTDKFDIVNRLQPKRIAEIGVRLGYSAHAFVFACEPEVWYVGYDVIGGPGGGTTIAGLEYAKSILHRDFPRVEVEMIQADTQRIDEFKLSEIDFFHVDGDHSEAGAFHDMQIAWATIRSGGAMVVDDYDYLPPVKRAVDRFAVEFASSIGSKEYLKTFRGDMVFIKK